CAGQPLQILEVGVCGGPDIRAAEKPLPRMQVGELLLNRLKTGEESFDGNSPTLAPSQDIQSILRFYIHMVIRKVALGQIRPSYRKHIAEPSVSENRVIEPVVTQPGMKRA